MVSHNPPLVMISFGGRRERIKDSEQNILTNKQYTISCSTEQYAEAINFAAINAPTGTSEFALTGLTPVPAVRVHAPRVGEAPFAMELEVDHTKQWNNDEGDHSTTMVIGRVKMIHLRQDIIDETGGVDIKALRPISRFAGTTYGRSVVGYDLNLPIWDEWKEDPDLQAALEKGPKKPDMDSIKATIMDKFP
jgi:flavin reductase (DIM6/NTAB) family NADH-FMN oxidoreductase RutF